MQEREALYRVAFELAEDAAAENVRHLEVRYSPMLHRKRRLSLEQIVDAVIAGLRDGGQRHRMSTGVIICGIRSLPPSSRWRSPNWRWPTRAAACWPSISPARRRTTRPRRTARVPAGAARERQLHGARGRGVRPGQHRAGAALLRRAPHRARHAAARGPRPDALRQRPPHPARGVPVVERADARRAVDPARTRSSSTSGSGCASRSTPTTA